MKLTRKGHYGVKAMLDLVVWAKRKPASVREISDRQSIPAPYLEKILIDRDPAQREAMMTRTGRRTVPQIYIGETHVGGYDDLVALDRAGNLDPLLA